jgi:hypothetical protein
MKIYQKAIIYLLKDGDKYPSQVGKLLEVRDVTIKKHITNLLKTGVIHLNKSGKLEYWEELSPDDYKVLPSPPPFMVLPRFPTKAHFVVKEIQRDLRKKAI